MNEIPEFRKLKKRVLKLMSGGTAGDGIGAYAASVKITKEFKTYYSPEEIHCIWQRAQPWYKGDSFPEAFDDDESPKKKKKNKPVDGKRHADTPEDGDLTTQEEVDDEDVVS